MKGQKSNVKRYFECHYDPDTEFIEVSGEAISSFVFRIEREERTGRIFQQQTNDVIYFGDV